MKFLDMLKFLCYKLIMILKKMSDINTLLRAEWSEPIIKAKDGTVLTKKDVYSYYQNPVVRKKLLSHLKDNNAIVIQSFVPGTDILRRKDDNGKEIKITKPSGSVYDSNALDYWTERRATEFHRVLGKTTDVYVVDIDPKEDVPFSETKNVALQVTNALDALPEVKNTTVFYSGNRGFHVIANLKKPMSVNKAKKNVADILKFFEPLGYSTKMDSRIRLDLSPMKHKGSYRVPYSLCAETGYVSIPVSKSDLPEFEKSDAAVSKFINPNLRFMPQRP